MNQQGRAISADIKKAIVRVKEYFDHNKSDVVEQGRPSIERTAHALGIGLVTVRRVMADFNRDPKLLEQPPKIKGRPDHVMPDSLQSIIREYIRSANKEGEFITLDLLRQQLIESIPLDDLNIRTLGRALDRWGFAFGKGIRSQHLKEKDHVIAARQRYIRRKRENRKGSGTIRPEVYFDESYINKNHSNDFTWYFEEDGPLVQKPTGQGERLIIINAITKDGWVPNAKLTYKSTKKTGDYHGQVNYELISKWFQEKLLPNIPKNSLIIMDNAPYHNVLSPCSAPIFSSKKEYMRLWLANNNVPVSDDCLKPEMIEILRKIAPSPTYAIDLIAEQAGHEVLRTPPYHPELQPIETCWGIVKNQVARNCDFTMANVLLQLDMAFSSVTEQTCTGLIKKIRQVEDDFWTSDLELDK
ncbi:MAG: transposase [Legionellaceae bacterium]|nr:transposase [Legionellaceae bacterium]